MDAPLTLADTLSHYIEFGADPKAVWKKYGQTVKGILESYLPRRRGEVAMQPNGLLWAQLDHWALSWMNAYIDGEPVTERPGYQVETNALWFRSILFAVTMEREYSKKDSAFLKEWSHILDLVRENYQKTFWNARAGYLADYVDNAGQHLEVRPNMLCALLGDEMPVDAEVARKVLQVIDNELVTRRGIRTLSPRHAEYKGVYEGTQTERDLAYHNGSTRPALVGPYCEVCFKMRGPAFLNKAQWLVNGFYEDLNKHGVGAFSELYDGDPPHEPHRAISSALSTAALLEVEYLKNKYRRSRTMRVLMFGWEFPPHIAGGLGTACYGIVKGLAYNGVQTLFVMPSASGDEDQSAARIISASDVPVESVGSTVDEFLDKVKFVRIGSNMIPYVDPEEFHEMVESERRLQSENLAKCIGTKFRFSGRYGSNLMEEVAHYAMVGGTIAMEHKDEFDIIHAHDWLTYLAGIAAKELTGKPLVVHVHATSFDRGTEDQIDSRVYDIERRG